MICGFENQDILCIIMGLSLKNHQLPSPNIIPRYNSLSSGTFCDRHVQFLAFLLVQTYIYKG